MWISCWMTPTTTSPAARLSTTVKGLPEAKQSDVPLFQPQNVIKPQLPLPPFHDEAVGIEQQCSGKKRHHNTSQIHQALEISGAPDRGNDLAGGQVTENVEHGRGTAAGEQIRPVVLAVAQQVYQGQPGKEAPMALSLQDKGKNAG